MAAQRVRHPPLGRARRRRGDAGGGAGEAVQGHREQRGAAAVHGDVGDVLPGELLDDLGDRRLERMGRVEVGVQGPAVERAEVQHRGVLAGAVLGQPGGRAALAHPGVPDGRAVRKVRDVAQVVLGEAGQCEDPAGPGEVAFLAGVAAHRQGEQVTVERQPGPHHGDGLHGLERGPRVAGRLNVAGAEAWFAVAAEDDDGTVVDALDHAATADVGDGRVEGLTDRGRVREGTAEHHCLVRWWGATAVARLAKSGEQWLF